MGTEAEKYARARASAVGPHTAPNGEQYEVFWREAQGEVDAGWFWIREAEMGLDGADHGPFPGSELADADAREALK